MVLEADCSYHFFDIQDTTAQGSIKGVWESHDGQLVVKSGLQRFAHYSFLFDSWNTLPPDRIGLHGCEAERRLRGWALRGRPASLPYPRDRAGLLPVMDSVRSDLHVGRTLGHLAAYVVSLKTLLGKSDTASARGLNPDELPSRCGSYPAR